VARKKTAAQLNREIAQSLARTSSTRSHLNKPTVDTDVVDDEEIFKIASDAFKEGNLHRGEQLVAQMQHPLVARCVKKTMHVVPKSFFRKRRTSKRSLYKLYSPMRSRSGTKHWWVVASTSMGETLVFPATEDGEIIEYDEIVPQGSETDHDAILKLHGYGVVTCGKKLRRPAAFARA
jgi:hypothetical protein